VVAATFKLRIYLPSQALSLAATNKYLLYDWDKKRAISKGIVERVTIGKSFIVHEVPGKKPLKVNYKCPDHKTAIELVVDTLTNSKYGVIKNLNQIAVNIAGIEAATALLPHTPQVAVFDTAWHQTMPSYAYIYALPYEWYKEYGIRRYGFHGTSLLYVAKRAAVLLGKDPFQCNLVSCHIGNGVSINAVKNGISVDTSMGFTPLEGAVMGTRAGDHDAAADLYMMREKKYSPNEMDDILNKKSGLLGISNKYTDQRDIIKAMEDGDRKAKLAFEIETYRLKKYIGAYMAVLGRVDAIIFTAGVGEMGNEVREKALEGLEQFGVKPDIKKNALARTRNAELDISADSSPVKIFIIPTDEEIVFVEDAVAILEKRYDVHTNFKYFFQKQEYRNKIRDEQFSKECKERPELLKIVAKVDSRSYM